MSLRVQHALVHEMAVLMEHKFNAKRKKDGEKNEEWWNRFIRREESVEWLLMRLSEEIGEFVKWYRAENWDEARLECADIANFAALIAWLMADRAAREQYTEKDIVYRYGGGP